MKMYNDTASWICFFFLSDFRYCRSWFSKMYKFEFQTYANSWCFSGEISLLVLSRGKPSNMNTVTTHLSSINGTVSLISSLDVNHYCDVIMGVMASQITSLMFVYSTIHSGEDKKTSKLRVTGLCEGNSSVTGEFPAQRASVAVNVSITWRHHGRFCLHHIYQCLLLQKVLILLANLKLYIMLTNRVHTRYFTIKLSIYRIYYRWLRNKLTHWGRMTHICVRSLTIIGQDIGL